jgi:glucosylceramidase
VNGFGAALTDSAAWLIHDWLRPRARARLLEDLFGTNGLDLQFLRLPMGASDFSAQGRPYSYDDMPPGRSDPTLKHFSIAHDRAYIIPTVRSALAIDPNIEILATPWSPPPWMKANDAFDNIGGLGVLLPSAYRPLAEYFVRFIRAYASAGINVTAVTPQNEPQGTSLFPGLELPWTTEARWITGYLAPALRAAGLQTKIYAADQEWFAPHYQDALVSSPAVTDLSGVAWHCYGASPSVMSHLHALAPQLDQVVSECAIEITPHTVPEIVIGSLRNYASTVALWNLALDPSGGPVQPPNSGCNRCRGLVTVRPATGTFASSLTYYQLGQFSHFISRGAVRIASSQPPGIDDVAVRNPDGSLTLVAYNQSASTARFAIAWNRRYLPYTLGPGATATFVWNPSSYRARTRSPS